MRPSARAFYRVAAVLIVVWAALHAAGFWTVDPAWRVEAVVEGMKTRDFPVMGFQRSYWDFFIGFGTVVTLFMAFSALLAWQLGRMADAMPRALRVVTWGFAAVFVLLTAITLRWFFTPPIVFSAAVSLCLVIAAARTRYAEGT